MEKHLGGVGAGRGRRKLKKKNYPERKGKKCTSGERI